MAEKFMATFADGRSFEVEREEIDLRPKYPIRRTTISWVRPDGMFVNHDIDVDDAIGDRFGVDRHNYEVNQGIKELGIVSLVPA